ncbi:MAG TPA: PAS domain S-box protein [Pyrinomonadaceae bacterium]|jgi:PAS domain S-box-containing protein
MPPTPLPAPEERAPDAAADATRLASAQTRLLDLAHALIRDLDDRIIFWNAGAQALYGWTAAEALGRVSHELLHTELPAPPAAIKEQLLRAGEWAGELTHTRQDGARLVVASHWVLHRDEQGRPAGVLEINNDITGRRQAEEALRFQAQLLDTVGQAVIATDPAGTVVYWNSYAESLYGWSAAEAVGRNVLELTPAEQTRTQAAEIMETLAAGASWTGEFVVRRRDGTSFPAQVVDTPLFAATGELIGIVGCSVNISGRKRIEAERDELLRREQTARREAETANRLKDEFLANVSHELRTPLTAILGWARLLQTSGLTGESAARAVQAIERNARAQTQLIDDLLDVSRIVSGKLRLHVQTLQLAPVIAAALDTVRPAAEAKGIELFAAVEPDVPSVFGDADRLQQVVWNLLANAVKFTPRGGAVRVALARRGALAELTVSDTGQGIAPEFLPYVFERFRQGDAAPARAHAGLGLGLAIVRHLVELHGGVVAAASAGEGRGATFTIQLPAGPDVDESAARAVARAAAPATATLQGRHVLVVDDDADACELLRLTLTKSGARVTIAHTAADALAALAREAPDLLVSDIGLPETDGYALIRAVRARAAQPGGARLPAVALTAYARPEDRAHALAAGFHAHIPKPVEPTALVAILADLLGQKSKLNGE